MVIFLVAVIANDFIFMYFRIIFKQLFIVTFRMPGS